MGGDLCTATTLYGTGFLCRVSMRKNKMKIRPLQPAPLAEKHPHTQSRFDTEWTDLYAWMRDDNWEMKGRLEPTARGVPMPDGPFAYFHFYREGDQHGVYARHDVTAEDPKDDIILDCDAEAQGTKFFDLGDVSHSPDHKWLAYSVDDKGSENYVVFLRDLETGEVSATGIDRSAGTRPMKNKTPDFL